MSTNLSQKYTFIERLVAKLPFNWYNAPFNSHVKVHTRGETHPVQAAVAGAPHDPVGGPPGEETAAPRPLHTHLPLLHLLISQTPGVGAVPEPS